MRDVLPLRKNHPGLTGSFTLERARLDFQQLLNLRKRNRLLVSRFPQHWHEFLRFQSINGAGQFRHGGRADDVAFFRVAQVRMAMPSSLATTFFANVEGLVDLPRYCSWIARPRLILMCSSLKLRSPMH